jgi:hypothetical protein
LIAMETVERVWYHGLSTLIPGELEESIRLEERGEADEVEVVDEVSVDAVNGRETSVLVL